VSCSVCCAEGTHSETEFVLPCYLSKKLEVDRGLNPVELTLPIEAVTFGVFDSRLVFTVFDVKIPIISEPSLNYATL
jgi:hypothetical protein